MTVKLTIGAGLMSALAQLSSLTSGATILPITRTVLLEQDEDGQRFISASDGKCYRQIPTTDFESEGPVKFCVEHAKLFSILKLHSNIECKVHFKENKTYKNMQPYKMDLTSSIGKANLPVEPGNDFIVKPDIEKYTGGFLVSSYMLRTSIDSARKFVLTGDYGAPLECVHLRTDSKRLYVSGTDRGQIYFCGIKTEVTSEIDYLLPKEVFNKITTHLPDADVQIDVRFYDKRGGIIVFDEQDFLSFASVDGEYHDILGMISKLEMSASIETENHQLQQVFKHLTELVDPKETTLVRCRVTPAGMHLSSVSQLKDYEAEIFIEMAVDGVSDEVTLLVDGLKMKTCLSSFHDVILIEFDSKPGYPIKMKSRDQDEDFRDVCVLSQMIIQ